MWLRIFKVGYVGQSICSSLSIGPFVKTNKNFFDIFVNANIIDSHEKSENIDGIGPNLRGDGFLICVMPTWIRVKKSRCIEYIDW